MKVLNFGSLNCDYVYRVRHIVNSGETISADSFNVFCGGKGLNQSIALRKAGIELFHAGSIGSDGEMLINALSAYGVDTSYIRKMDMPTGHAIIQVDDNGENSIVLFGGANRNQSKAFINEVLNDFGEDDVIILQNEINNLSYIIECAYKRKMFIVLNPSPYNFEVEECDLNKVSMLFINEIEGEQISKKTNHKEIIEYILKRYPNMQIVLTLGGDGAVYASKTEYLYQEAIESVVKDTTAAGDTFLGYFVSGRLQGMNNSQSLLLAAKASAITISKSGASDTIPNINELETLANE